MSSPLPAPLDLNAVRMFAKVVETRTFTGAAATLGMTQSGVSRAIDRLEKELGVTLLRRTTRSVEPTADGIALYIRSTPLLAGFNDVDQAIRQPGRSLTGTLRLVSPPVVGRLLVMPVVNALCARNPGLRVDVRLTERKPDFSDIGLDAAIQLGGTHPASLAATQVNLLRPVTAASPGYLRHREAPTAPRDLRQHNCLVRDQRPRAGCKTGALSKKTRYSALPSAATWCATRMKRSSTQQ